MAIKINIGSLKDGSQVIGMVSDAKELGLDDNLLKENINISLELTKTVHQLDVRADVKGKLNLTCDRCLEEFDKPFDTRFELVFVQQSPREEPINEDYIRTYSPHMRQVDITNDIKEMIILTVPMRKVPDEKPDGSCSWCGKGKDYWNNLIKDEEELNNL